MAGGSSDPSFSFLYPYDQTIFPQGLLSPTMQFGGVAPDAAVVQIAGGGFTVSGSANGSPDSSGYTLGVECIPFGKITSFARPFLNVRTGLQYTIYTRFNGGNSDYDGSGRSASQNDTLYGYIWLAF